MASPAQPPAVHPSPRETPRFEISVDGSRGQLMLRPGRFFGWLRVDRFELAIPNVTFPLDITGGMAQFQRQRCPLLAATLTIDPEGLAQLAAQRAGPLAMAGFENLSIELVDGAIELSALARVRERTAELWVRLAVGSDGRQLRIALEEAVTLGWVRRPSTLLAHDLLCILLGAVDATRGSPAEADAMEGPTVRGLGEIVLQPMELFAATVLSPSGWRLPRLDDVRLGEIAITPEHVRLHFSTEPGELPTLQRPAALARIGEPLLRNDLAGAVAACRQELPLEPAEARESTKLLLELLSARDGSVREAELIARDALLRWPDFVYGHLTLAAVASSRGREAQATEHFAEAARLADAAGRVSLGLRAALAAARGAVDQDPARAIALYEQASKRRPGDPRVVAALAELYARSNRWAELARLYQGQIAGATDGRAKATAHLKLAEVRFQRLHDPSGARTEIEEATRLDPRSRRAWDLRAEIALRAGDRLGAMAALRQAAGLLAELGDAIAQARTLARIGAILEQTGDAAGARDYYRRALTLTPEDPGVLQSFAALAEAQHETADALDAYQRLARSSSAAQEAKRTAQAKLLGLYVQTEDLPAARRALGDAQTEPDAETLTRLAALEEAAGELLSAASLLERAEQRSEGLSRAQLELERARLFQLVDAPDRQRTALERAHSLAPGDPEGEKAVRALVAMARAAGDASDEGAWLDALLARAPRDAEELMVRRAQLFHSQGDAAAARKLIERLSDPMRARGEVRRLFADVLGALGDPSGRAELLDLEADSANSDDERASLLVSAAESRLAAGDVEGARRDVVRAEQLAPSDPRVRLAVAEVAWRRRNWEEVLTLYDELFAESGGTERVEHGRRLGVALERLGRPAEALDVFRRAIAAEDAAGAPLGLAWRACAEAHERAGDYARTAEVLREAALDPRTGDELAARIELLRRAAELVHRRAGAHAQAVALLEEALRLSPEDLLTLDALEALQSELGDPRQLADTLERKLALPSVTHAQRLEWLARLAELAGGDAAAARHHHARILELDPANEASLRFLAADTWAQGDLEVAARHFAALLTRPELSRDEAFALRLRIADLAEQRNDVGEAEVQLWAAVELAPPGEQSALLRRLEAVYTRGERWSDLAMVLVHHESRAEPSERLAIALRRIEVLLRRLKTPAEALEAIHALLQHHPDEPRLLELWVEAARAAGDGAELAGGLTRLVRRAPDARTQAPLIAEAFQLGGGAPDLPLVTDALEQHLGGLRARSAPADDTVRSLLDLLRKNAEDSLTRLALADALVTAAELPGEPAQSVAWLVEAADLRRGRLDDFAGAADALGRAVAIAPSPGLVRDLETLLTDLGDGTRLAALYQQQLATAAGDARARLLEKLARASAELLGDERAAERWHAELRQAAAPASPVNVAALVRTIAPAPVATAGNARAAIEKEERTLASLPAHEVVAIRRTRLRLGQLYDQAERLADAHQQLATVLAEEPSNRTALEALVDVTQKQGLWAEAAQAWERLSHLYDDPSARAEALYRQGELLLVRLGDKERAAEAYLKAIDVEPSHAPTARRLIDYFWSIDDRASVAEIASGLDAETFAAKETTPGTRARAALAAALGGDRRASRQGAALGPGGPQALARAAADAAGRSIAPRALAQAITLVCAGAPSLLAETQRALGALAAQDSRLRAVVSLL